MKIVEKKKFGNLTITVSLFDMGERSFPPGSVVYFEAEEKYDEPAFSRQSIPLKMGQDLSEIKYWVLEGMLKPKIRKEADKMVQRAMKLVSFQ